MAIFEGINPCIVTTPNANCVITIGTGKTTVARYMSTLLYDLGLLPTKTFVESSAADFIGEHVGHTAPKTRAQFEKGLGGVLFIDHAHQLKEGGYATEAINELVRLLQKHVGKIIVILAGPSEEIEALMAKSHGLDGSFFKEVNFQKLAASDCLALLKQMLRENGIGSSFFNDPMDERRFLNQFDILSSLTYWRNANDVRSLSEWMVTDVLTSFAPSGQASNGLNLSVEQANFYFHKMFEMKSSMQFGDLNIGTGSFRQSESSQMANSFHMVEEKPQVYVNSQDVHTATDVETEVNQEEVVQCAYDEQWDKVKSLQQTLQMIGKCVAGFDWVREGSGYRCKGGSHYVSDSQIQSQSL